MAEDRRRLVAILAADVVGYSRLMGADEAGTLARLRVLFADAIRPVVRDHGGRIFKLMGDAFLAEFGSAVEAVRAAGALQEAIAAREAPDLRLRIGVHLGDVVVQGSDLLGDGVNIAARLEGEAESGGVAVSAAVVEAVRGRVPFALEDRGERTLKNIDRPLRVYRLAAPDPAPALAAEPALALPDKPSLVVLPFQNMSGDAEQDYFVDGLVEDITTALSCIRSFFVIARNSAFTYKGRAVDVRQVGRELGVRYVLEGSVRKAGGRIRITSQLIDATTGTHLWADRFDGAADDVFDLQDRVVERVAGAIEPSLTQAEAIRAEQKATSDLGAYDLFLRGMALLNRTLVRSQEAQALFLQAAARDPRYGVAWGMAASCFSYIKAQGLLEPTTAIFVEAQRLAQLAAENGRDDPFALAGAAWALAYACMDPEAGSLLIDRACALNPNSAFSWNVWAYIRICLGDPAAALAACERALRLSPRDPRRANFLHQTAMAHGQAGRYEEAVAWAERAVSEAPNVAQFLRTLLVSLALAGRVEEARRVMTEVRRIQPNISISTLERIRGPFRNVEYQARMVQAYRAAGMPE